MQLCVPLQVYYLSLGNEIHVIRNNSPEKGSITVDRYVSQELYLEYATKNPITEYELFIKTGGFSFTKKTIKFFAPSMFSVFNWNHFDYFIVGYNSSITNSLKYWSKRFVLVPLEKLFPFH